MPPTLRQEHRDATRRRVVEAARAVFIDKGYTRATIEDITVAAGVSRATLYQHFDSKHALFAASTATMRAESVEAARRLAEVLAGGDRAELRDWVRWALGWFAANRPMARAGEEAELSVDGGDESRRRSLEHLEPWVQTWPPEQQAEARMRWELCRLQLHHYMWGPSQERFADRELAVDLITEIWWTALRAPVTAPRQVVG